MKPELILLAILSVVTMAYSFYHLTRFVWNMYKAWKQDRKADEYYRHGLKSDK